MGENPFCPDLLNCQKGFPADNGIVMPLQPVYGQLSPVPPLLPGAAFFLGDAAGFNDFDVSPC